MKPDSSTISWNKVGKEFAAVARSNDFRMYFVMPYTLQQLGDVTGKAILDLGCGEGGYARALAQAGAAVTAVDCAVDAVQFAINQAAEEGLQIDHRVRNSNDLYGLADGSFDIVLCAMMLMDCEDLPGTVKEISRVLRPGGKVFASVLHPCFNGKAIRWTGPEDEKTVVVENYFLPQEWEAVIAGTSFPVIFRHRTLSDYVKVFVQNNLALVDLNEPVPTPEQVAKSPRIGRLARIPMFLFMEFRK